MCGYVVGEDEADVKRRYESMLAAMPPQFRSNLQQSTANGALRYLPMLVGTPPQLVEQIKALEEEGISRVMLQNRTPPTYETLALVAREVLPKVQ
jgi:alkanesulfonate monooxygenase SsuD/methylene tetrahydromethanopterin reductase-like flavin-dependent oxidoreductase (luciferase family)